MLLLDPIFPPIRINTQHSDAKRNDTQYKRHPLSSIVMLSAVFLLLREVSMC
jgi:hypothetical protein